MNKKRLNLNSGYILAFALILTAVTLTITLSVTRIISKELFFSSLANSSKKAYSVTDAGLECAQYLDSTFRNSTSGVAIILNSTSTTNGENDFQNNLENVVFAKSALNLIAGLTGIPLSDSADLKRSKIFCVGTFDDSYNKMFTIYANSSTSVKTNLESNNPESSYHISGSSDSATTTFGLVIKNIKETNFISNSCALIQYAKIKSDSEDSTKSWNIISTGYSSCNPQDKSRVVRTIVRHSTE